MIKSFEFEGRLFRSKCPIPFVEAGPALPAKVYADGYFPVGTVFKFQGLVCSKKIDPYREQVNDYCHAAALSYSNRDNGAAEGEPEYTTVFHVDLSALFLLMDPLDGEGKPVAL